MSWNRDRVLGIGHVAGGRGLGNVAEFVSLALAARLLGPASYGKFAFFLAVALISGQLFDFGLGRILSVRTSFMRGAETDSKSISRTYGALLGIRVYGAALVPVLLIITIRDRQERLILPGLAMGFLISSIQCIASIFQSKLQFAHYSATIWLPGILHLGGVLGLSISHTSSLKALLLLYPLTQLVSLCALAAFLPRHELDYHAMRYPGAYLRPLIGYGKWLMCTALLEVLYLKTDVIALKRLSTPYQLGIYAVAFTLAGVFNLVFNAVVANYVPVMCRLAGQRQLNLLSEYFRESTDTLAMIVIPMAIGLWAVCPTLMPLLFGAKYQASISIWSILVLFSVASSLNATGCVFFALQRFHMVALINVWMFLCGAGLCIYLVPRYGASGAALAMSISAASSLVFSWILTYRAIRALPNFGFLLFSFVSSLAFVPLVREIRIANPWMDLAAKVLTGVLVYGALMLARNSFRSASMKRRARMQEPDESMVPAARETVGS